MPSFQSSNTDVKEQETVDSHAIARLMAGANTANGIQGSPVVRGNRPSRLVRIRAQTVTTFRLYFLYCELFPVETESTKSMLELSTHVLEPTKIVVLVRQH